MHCDTTDMCADEPRDTDLHDGGAEHWHEEAHVDEAEELPLDCGVRHLRHRVAEQQRGQEGTKFGHVPKITGAKASPVQVAFHRRR